MKYCIHCGSEMSDEAEFCKNCGKGVKTIKEVSGKSVARKPLIIGCSIGIVLLLMAVVSLIKTGVIFREKDDRTRLQEIINEQRVQGAKVEGIATGSGDGSNKEHQYVWDDEGNLIGLNWSENKSLVGDISLSDFTHLEVLQFVDGGNQKLTGLDVSGCSALTRLGIEGGSGEGEECQLTNLNLSGCTALVELWCTNSTLKEVDISDCKSLQKLSCYSNQLSSLDVSACANLEELVCSYNQLNSLDVSACTNLKELDCSNIQLNSLDVSACVNLERLDCSNTQLNSLDVSACTKLEHLSTDSSCIVKGYEKH